MGKREGQRSLPLRECGLKFEYAEQHDWEGIVTPLAGVWVEIIWCGIKKVDSLFSMIS